MLSSSSSEDFAMSFLLRPWQLLLVIVAGWMNREQQAAIDYLRAENQVLREKLGTGRILLNDDQRRPFAVTRKVLGWKRLKEIGGLSPLEPSSCNLYQSPVANRQSRAPQPIQATRFEGCLRAVVAHFSAAFFGVTGSN